MKNVLLRIALIVSILVLIAAIAGGILYFISPGLITGILFGFNYMVFVIGGVDLILLILLILSLRISTSLDIRNCYINAKTEQDSKKKFNIKQIVRIVFDIDGADDMIRADYYGISLDAEGEVLRIRLESACDVDIIDRFKKDLESAFIKAYNIVIPNYRFIAKSVVYSYAILDNKSDHKLFNDKLTVTATAASDEPTVSDKSRVLAIINRADKQDQMIAGATYNEGIENFIDIALKDDYDIGSVDALKCRIEKTLYDELNLVVSQYKFSGKDSEYNYEITDTAKQHKLFSDKLVVTTSRTLGGKGKIDKKLVYECIETADKEDPIVLTDEDYIEFDEDGGYISIILTTDNSVDQVDSFKCRLEGLLRKHGIVFSKYIFNSNEREYIFTILDDKNAHSLYNDTLVVTETAKEDGATDEIAEIFAMDEPMSADENVLFASSADVVSAIYGADDAQQEMSFDGTEQDELLEQEQQEHVFAEDLILDYIQPEDGIISTAETEEDFTAISEEQIEIVSVDEQSETTVIGQELISDNFDADVVSEDREVEGGRRDAAVADNSMPVVSGDEASIEENAEERAEVIEQDVVLTGPVAEESEEILRASETQEDSLTYTDSTIETPEHQTEDLILQEVSEKIDIEDHTAPEEFEEPAQEVSKEAVLAPETAKVLKKGKKNKKTAALVAGGVIAAAAIAAAAVSSGDDGAEQREHIEEQPVLAEQIEQAEAILDEQVVAEQIVQEEAGQIKQAEAIQAEQVAIGQTEQAEAGQTEQIEAIQAEQVVAGQEQQAESSQEGIAREYEEQSALSEQTGEQAQEVTKEISSAPETVKKDKKGKKSKKTAALIAGGAIAAAAVAAAGASSGEDEAAQTETAEIVQAEPLQEIQAEAGQIAQVEPIKAESNEVTQTEHADSPVTEEIIREQETAPVTIEEALAETVATTPRPVVEADGNEYIYVKEGERFDPGAYDGELVKVGEDYIYEEEIVYEEVPLDEDEQQTAGTLDPEEQYRKMLTMDIMSSIMEINGEQDSVTAEEKISPNEDGFTNEDKNEENVRRVKEKVRKERESAMTTAAVKTSSARSRSASKPSSKPRAKPPAKAADSTFTKDAATPAIPEVILAPQTAKAATKLVPVVKTKLTKREIYAIKRDIMRQTKELLDIIEEIDPSI